MLIMCIDNLVLNHLISSSVTRRSWLVHIRTSQGIIKMQNKYTLLPEFFYGKKLLTLYSIR